MLWLCSKKKVFRKDRLWVLVHADLAAAVPDQGQRPARCSVGNGFIVIHHGSAFALKSLFGREEGFFGGSSLTLRVTKQVGRDSAKSVYMLRTARILSVGVIRFCV